MLTQMYRVLGIVALLFACSCVRTTVEDTTPKTDPLMVARGVDGVTLQWRSQLGRAYSLYYRDKRVPNSQWRVVPKIDRVRGTGELMEFQDQSAYAAQREYKLHTIFAQDEAGISVQ